MNSLKRNITFVIIFAFGLLLINKLFFIKIGDYHYYLNSKSITLSIATNKSVSSEDINKLKKFKYLNEIYIYGIEINNLDFVENMNNLEKITLNGSRSIKSLKPLQKCTNLKYIELTGVCVENLSDLSNLKKIEYIDFSEVYSIEVETNSHGINSISGI